MGSMKLLHAALRVSSFENARRFYEEFLGLELVREYELDIERARKLFGVRQRFSARLYKLDNALLEVFVGGAHELRPKIEHVCLEVRDRESLKKRAEEMKFKTIEVERKEKQNLIFIYDPDGNIFEIKSLA